MPPNIRTTFFYYCARKTNKDASKVESLGWWTTVYYRYIIVSYLRDKFRNIYRTFARSPPPPLPPIPPRKSFDEINGVTINSVSVAPNNLYRPRPPPSPVPSPRERVRFTTKQTSLLLCTIVSCRAQQVDNDSYYFRGYAHWGVHETMLTDTVRTGGYERAICDNAAFFKDKVRLSQHIWMYFFFCSCSNGRFIYCFRKKKKAYIYIYVYYMCVYFFRAFVCVLWLLFIDFASLALSTC